MAAIAWKAGKRRGPDAAESSGHSRRNPLDVPRSGVRVPEQLGDQPSELQQIRRPERGPPRRDHHERIPGRHIGPLRRQTRQLTGIVEEVHPIGPPGPATLHELKRPPGQRMKPMRHPHPARMLLSTRITSSPRLGRITDLRMPSAATSSPRKSAAPGAPLQPSSATAASVPTSPPPAATATTHSPPSVTPSPAPPGCHRNQHDQLTRHP